MIGRKLKSSVAHQSDSGSRPMAKKFKFKEAFIPIFEVALAR